jgi:DNA-nicking Smr family endonuclease
MARRQAKKAATGKPRGEQAEPFFRPFSGLKPKKPKAEPAGASAPGAAGAKEAPASKANAAAAPPKAPKKPAPIEPPRLAPGEEAVAPIDPHTFAIYMSGVKALEDRATRIPKTASRLERADRGLAPVADADATARDRMRSLVVEGLRFETLDDGDRIEGRRLDVDPRELRRLRRAQYAIDGKLDLHGMGVEEGRRAVEAFVKKRALDGDKVVVIVHGKGSHSPRQNAVLRGEIGAWLSQGRSSRYIRAFATTPEDEGGAGAVLVMLTR